MLLELHAKDPALAAYGKMTTEQTDKIMAGVPEIGSAKIGRIESVAAVVSACRDGEAATAGLSCIVNMGDAQELSLKRVGKMVERNGGKYFSSVDQVAVFLNGTNRIEV